MTKLVERFRGPGAALEECLRWRMGSMRDYGALAQFHYLRNKPVTATRVLVVQCADEAVAERWKQLQQFRQQLEQRTKNSCDFRSGAGRVVGVLVESLPALSCRLRDVAIGSGGESGGGGRYGGWKDRGMGARLLNSEVRCISRVVVHPQWRGVGLAVKLVRWALQTMTTPYTEALAAMGRVHPFFRLAGMTEYRRPALVGRQRMLDAMRYCGVETWELASEERMRRVLEGEKNPGQGEDAMAGLGRWALLRRELARWAGRRLTLAEQLAKARQELLCEVVYYGFAREEECRPRPSTAMTGLGGQEELR